MRWSTPWATRSESDAFGGGFVYGMTGNMVSVGQLTSLDYADPFIDPHREFQKFKLHPLIAGLLKDGKLVQYGAKTVPVGGYYSMPELTFPGGLIIGDGANLFNARRSRASTWPCARACWPPRPSSPVWWPTISPTRGWPATPRPWPGPRR